VTNESDGTDKRLDKYAEWCVESINGESGNLVEEMDAALGFLKMYEKEFAAEEDYRMAVILGTLHDAIAMLVLRISLADKPPPPSLDMGVQKV
jgi:hypothetical protein